MFPIPVAMVTWLVFLVAVSAALDPTLEESWRSWKKLHAKQYLQAEEASRRAIWEENLRKINKHNQEASKGLHMYRLAMNHLGDLTDNEFNEKMNGFRPAHGLDVKGRAAISPKSSSVLLPRSVDWRTKGYVTPVKNQGTCGACWAFSATGALEGLHFKTTGRLVSLSEQNLIDCSRGQGNRGCHGGEVSYAFEYVRKNRGINSEAAYPYLERDGRSCRFNPSNRAATCNGMRRIPPGDEAALHKAVARVGPVSVGVDAQSHAFHFYSSGVFQNPSCGQHVDHAMLVVGYGTDQTGTKYWIIKNSWTTRWGENGYMRLLRGVNNHCGVASQAIYPTL